jgi:hypothetical protein
MNLEELLARGEPELNTGCLLWPGANNGRYGRVWHEGRVVYVHHLSYQLSGGLGGPQVLHRCDTPACFWPPHLFGGSQSENVVDAMAKGRLQQVGPKGERSSTARLKATDIPAIRSDPRDNILIAPEYGVSDVTIGNVKRRKTWNHIP